MAHQQPMYGTVQSPVASVAQPQTGTGGYKAPVGIITGGVQIVLGVAFIIVGVVPFCIDFWGFFEAAGWRIWGGVVSMMYGISLYIHYCYQRLNI